MVTPYYQDDSCTIYHADCRDVLPHITGDVVVTSPPYNLNTRITTDRRYISRGARAQEFSTKYAGGYPDDLHPDDYFAMTSQVLGLCLNSCPSVCWNVQVATGNKVAVARLLGEWAGSFKELIVWDKVTAEPAMKDRTLNSAFELVIVFGSSDPMPRQFRSTKFDRGTQSNLWHIGRAAPIKGHGATFPEGLVHHCLDLHGDAVVVVDPFAGTGTALRVAKDRGLRSVGIEIEERFCEIAAQRLAQEVLPL